jgi:primosomal protein N' (replication factor Y)
VPEPAAPPRFVEVAVNVPVDQVFVYALPPEMAAGAVPGRRVRVPFGKGNRREAGYLVGARDDLPKGLKESQVKPLEALLDDGPLLDAGLLDMGRFVSRWYASSLGEALDAALPAAVKREGRGQRLPVAVLRGTPEETRAAAAAMAPKQAKRARILLALVENGGRMPVRELCRVTHASRSPVDSLAKLGHLVVERPRSEPDPFASRGEVVPVPAPVPTPAQRDAVAAVTGAMEAARFEVFLLLGITGSGKTEVYLRALEETVRLGRQGIVLVPEIALTPQTVDRFRARVPRIAVLHSALTDAERHSQWKRIRRGEADGVIGPRSAVFAPVPRLGLLVLDEEHEPTFKQQNAPRYHARDAGIWRAREAGAVVVLGSATPSLESYRNALEGKYRLLRLPERAGGGSLPPVEVVDMLREREEAGRPVFLSRRLEQLVDEALRGGQQSLLFLNRRGYATAVSCGRCGHRVDCKGCGVPYTWHRRLGMGLCHYCGGETAVGDACPGCGVGGLHRRGFGTEKVEESLRARWPGARIARMDSDTMKGRAAYEKVLDAFRRRELDLLVGTQMIAKGLDFPEVTVVGVLNADLSLSLPDFRAGERTFQLLAQVAGRAGRAEKAGRVVVQTTLPDNPAVARAAKHDYEGWAAGEIEERRGLGYPPFGRLLRAVASSPVDARAREIATEAADAACAAVPGAEVLGPAPAPMPRVQDRWRWHFLLKAKDPRDLARAAAAVRPLCRRAPEGDLLLDVEPLGTM